MEIAMKKVVFGLFCVICVILSACSTSSSDANDLETGIHTGEYTGWLHYYDTASYTEILLTLVEYGDKITGVMTGADNPGEVNVDITATVSGTGISMNLDGLGAIEGVTGTTI